MVPFENPYDYQRFAILYVDDETLSLRGLQTALGGTFKILTAPNAEEGLRILQENLDDIAVVMTDQQMPGMKGVQFLERVRQIRPRIIRILVTAYTDLDAAIQAVNQGAIYRYVQKPWDVAELERDLKRSLEFFLVQRERDSLMREKLSVLHKMVITDRVLSLGVLAAGLGHHVRNAMAAVRTFLDLAPEMLGREKLDLGQLQHPGFWHDFHSKVHQRVNRVVELLDNLSHDTGTEKFRFDSKVRLRDAIDGAIRDLQPELSQRKITIRNEVPADLPELTVDSHRFNRLFELLFRDELANLNDGGTVVCEASVTKSEFRGAPELSLIISDNGPGLPADAIRSVFDPFFVRNDDPKEFGIYLMAVYFLVYHHGGRISVASGPQGGLRFEIDLPLTPPTAADAEKSQDFLARVMTNERLWERILSQP
jgi:two-component system, probable response regulator PhcQ